MATLDKPFVDSSSSSKVGLPTTTTTTSSPPPPPLPPRIESLVPVKGGKNKLYRSYPSSSAGSTATSATSSIAGDIESYTLNDQLKRHPIVLRGINQGTATVYPANTNLPAPSLLKEGKSTVSVEGLGTALSEASTLGQVRTEITTGSFDVVSSAQTTVMYVQLPGPILRVEMPTPLIKFDTATQQV